LSIEKEPTFTEARGEAGVVVKSEDQRARCIIKVSRLVRSFLEEKAEPGEPTDRTVRRLLGLKMLENSYERRDGSASKGARKKKVAWTTIKVTEFVRAHIIQCAKWNESVDHTLRRLLKLPFDG
jgi:hypothetical protein